jgi:hypothetical protein
VIRSSQGPLKKWTEHYINYIFEKRGDPITLKGGWHGLNYGLQTPNEAFFYWNPELVGLGRLIRQINSGAFWYFQPKYQHPFWYSESLVHVFHYSTIISTKTRYPHPKYFLGIGI